MLSGAPDRLVPSRFGVDRIKNRGVIGLPKFRVLRYTGKIGHTVLRSSLRVHTIHSWMLSEYMYTLFETSWSEVPNLYLPSTAAVYSLWQRFPKGGPWKDHKGSTLRPKIKQNFRIKESQPRYRCLRVGL